MEKENKKIILLNAAVLGILLGQISCATGNLSTESSGSKVAKGECHSINSCKGKGECGGAGTSCAGTNQCKGKGWITLTQAECVSKGGTFKP